ncbi:hypothetical protein G6F37_009269 [Rhizopus arrhizus]|nr:hypothetical protein G6F38_002387 [Rhizopus arrhizus]KAG1154634.1 hypothetical protein G6F37_009269 [Rhizopus arrhizus]
MEFELLTEEITPLLTNQGELNESGEKKPSPWYIIIPVFTLSFAYGASIAPTVEALSVIYCYKYYRAQGIDISDIPFDHCNIPAVQSLVSEAQAAFLFLSNASTLIFAGYYGTLSDRKGRRLVMVISLLGGIIPFAGLVLTLRYFGTFDVFLLYAANTIRGFLAGDSVLIATANAYLTDCTTQSNRTSAFSYLAASACIGLALGPYVGSFIIKQTGSINSVFYVIIAIHIAFIMYNTFFLPESNDITKYKPSPKQTFLQSINVFSAIGVFFRKPVNHASRWTLPILALVQVLIYIASLPPFLLYAMLKFGWTAYEGGLFYSITSSSRLVMMLVILPLITKLFNKSLPILEKERASLNTNKSSPPKNSSALELEEMDLKQSSHHSMTLDIVLIRIGLCFKTVAMTAFGLTATSSGFFLTGILESVDALANPSLRSLMTALVDPSQTGELWGALATLDSCSVILSQLLINYIYSASVSTMPSFTFFVCAGISGVAMLLIFMIHSNQKKLDEEA